MGTLVYVVDRPADVTPFFSIINLEHLGLPRFGLIGQSLPTFAHVFAFSILTAVFLRGWKHAAASSCVVWFVVDTAFEVGQHEQIAPEVSTSIFAWLGDHPIFEHIPGYFMAGTFDLFDLLSIALGAILAYLLIRRQRDRNHRNR
jgi:hypothetical protein